MIIIAGICISLFLCLFILVKVNKSKADLLLFLWLFCIAIHLSLFYIDKHGISEQYPFLLGVIIPFPLLHGPFLFLYASELTKNVVPKRTGKLIHFVPFLLVCLYLSKFFVLPAQEKLYILNNEGKGFEGFVLINLLLIIISGIGYIAWTILILNQYQRKIKNQYADLEKINLKWLKYLTYGLGAIWMIVLFGEDDLIFAAVSIYIVIIGFFGIRQVNAFHEKPFPVFEDASQSVGKPINSINELNEKYATSGLNEEHRKVIRARLQMAIEIDKVYFEPELSLNLLAEHLNVHPNYLSQYINEELKMSFYNYINEQRVKEFIKKIDSNHYQEFSLLGLALDCGFNSKSSFNRNFKSLIGQTPSQYIKSIKA